jgi:hypothetical protein
LNLLTTASAGWFRPDMRPTRHYEQAWDSAYYPDVMT